MAFGNYSELQDEIASFLHRDDLTSQIPSFIKLAEADMQVRAKFHRWAASELITITDGVSDVLPSDYVRTQSVTLPGERTLLYLPPAQFDTAAAGGEAGDPIWYTHRNLYINTYPLYTGSLRLNYMAQFTPLSDSAPTSSLLSRFPDAYLNGSLMHAANWTQDDAALQKYAALFEANIRRIKTFISDLNYPDGLQMRAA